jgi:hemolysin III
LEETLNAMTHGFGCVVSLAASLPLLRPVIGDGASMLVLSLLAYCGSLSAVYAASTLSHWVQSAPARRLARSWDQGLIYVLITATYTPLAVIYLNGWWHVLTILMWGIAGFGFFSKVALAHQVDRIEMWLYLLLGWLPALALPALLSAAPWRVVALVLVGGVTYTVGAVLLIFDERARFLHTGWHLFVLIGSWCHYLAIYFALRS